MERERIERQKHELLRLEREHQRMEREKLEREREELRRQQMRFVSAHDGCFDILVALLDLLMRQVEGKALREEGLGGGRCKGGRGGSALRTEG